MALDRKTRRVMATHDNEQVAISGLKLAVSHGDWLLIFKATSMEAAPRATVPPTVRPM